MHGTPLHSSRMAFKAAWVLSLLGFAWPVCGQVQISEWMAQNVTALQDEDGDYSDWIEIHNAGSVAVDLDGWHLSDTPTHLTRWTFPPTALPAGGFLLVYASGKNKMGTELHANFSLSDEGEYLALVHPDGITVEHEYTPAYPEQFPDISYGLQTHGSNPTLRAGAAGYLITHTPGTSNTCIPALHPLYSEDSVAQVDLDLSQATWDALMEDPWSDTYEPVQVRFRHGDIDIMATNAGIKCRGASTREIQPRSFTIRFDAFVPGQRLLNMEKIQFNSTAVEPSTVRTKLIHDLHEEAGLPTPYANHVALVIHGPDWDRDLWVGGRFFDAIRIHTQPIDTDFLRQRLQNSRGNLYKSSGSVEPASLDYLGPDGSAYQNHGYDLQVAGSGDTSFDDLAALISTINLTSDTDFPNAILQVFDVDGFLRRLALDVLTGNYDNYWIACHNYKLYRHPDTRRWSYFAYDFDLTFGVSWSSVDWTTQSIETWADIPEGSCAAPLANRILSVPEFEKRYKFYMKQMLDSFYSQDSLTSTLFHYRSIMTQPLPFETGSITNMKNTERERYVDDWPNWTYSQFFDSFTHSPTSFTTHGLTNFIERRRTSALHQMARGVTIAPILSNFTLTPGQPDTNDTVTFSIRAFDDTSISTVSLQVSFQGNPTNTAFLVLQPDGSYAVTLPAFNTPGVVQYSVRAEDPNGNTTFHPYGGPDYSAELEIARTAHHLVISEMNYHPYPLTEAEIAAGVMDSQDFEFIELFNSGSASLDLEGVQITDGVGGTAPSFTLGANEYAVFVKNTNAFRFRYTNTLIRIIGPFQGNLGNGGDSIRLEHAGEPIATLTYNDSDAWPDRADGEGSSLVRIDFLGEPSSPLNWRASSTVGGTPGNAGENPASRVVINEVLTHSDLPLTDTIELHNVTESALDISGWFLSDAKGNYRKYAIPSDTILPGNGYIAFDEVSHFNTSGGLHSNDFALDGSHGDTVFLLETDEQGHLIRFEDCVEFGAAANGESFGRWPNGSGQLTPMDTRTFGSANSGPRVGPIVISELMYDPPSNSNPLEFIELANLGQTSVDLTHWRLDGGVDYAFPTSTFLPTGQVLVILSFDPALPSNSTLLDDFQMAYQPPSNATLIGAFSGPLSNTGNQIQLLRPDDPPLEEPEFIPMLLEDQVSYSSTAPWPIAPAGNGASLSRCFPAAWGDAAFNWTQANPPTPGSIHTSSEYQLWAAEQDIPSLVAINPVTGFSYAEEFLLQTNGASTLHQLGHASLFPIYSHIPMVTHGIHNRIEISTDLTSPSSWRNPLSGELVWLSNQTYRVHVPPGFPFFIRLQLIPIQ